MCDRITPLAGTRTLSTRGVSTSLMVVQFTHCIKSMSGERTPRTPSSRRGTEPVDNRGIGLCQTTLTLSRELSKLDVLLMIAPSSNGKTADSGSAYRGSNPCGAAYQPANHWFLRPYRLTVRTEPSQGSNTGSIPVKATNASVGRLLTGIAQSGCGFFSPCAARSRTRSSIG